MPDPVTPPIVPQNPDGTPVIETVVEAPTPKPEAPKPRGCGCSRASRPDGRK